MLSAQNPVHWFEYWGLTCLLDAQPHTNAQVALIKRQLCAAGVGGASSSATAANAAARPVRGGSSTSECADGNSTSGRKADGVKSSSSGDGSASSRSAEGGDACGTRHGGAADSIRGCVEALTVDKYQGRDKAVILISFVRSNTRHSTGRLLADWQRLNVALTRAKVKLLMVGSAETLGSVPLLAQLLSMLRERRQVAAVPPEALAVA